MNTPQKNCIPEELFERILTGSADTNDIISFEQWKGFHSENQHLFEEFKRLWQKKGLINPFTDIELPYDVGPKGILPELLIIQSAITPKRRFSWFRVAFIISFSLIFLSIGWLVLFS